MYGASVGDETSKLRWTDAVHLQKQRIFSAVAPVENHAPFRSSSQLKHPCLAHAASFHAFFPPPPTPRTPNPAEKMDWRLEEACLRGDLPGFRNLVQEKDDILSQTTAAASNNALHIASRFGWAELVGEIVRLRPDLVLGENEKKETPCHEACREGLIDVLMLLIESNPWVVYKLNKNGESGLFLACGRGHVDLVKHLLSRSSFLLACEEDGMPASLHASVSGGFAACFEIPITKQLSKFYTTD
ncbi:hypothetical protein ACLOJK_040189 [Asimina triloba]